MKEAVNPFLPSYEYVPDGEPHIFGDRVYLYGSHDKFGGKDYCENDYVCWSASIDNLANWRYEGVIYRKEDGPLKVKGTIPSYIACNLIDGINYKEKEEKALNSLRISQDGPDREVGEDQYVSHIHNTCVIGYKYFELPAPIANTTLTNASKSTNMTLNLTIRGEAKGKFNIKLIYKNSTYENVNICFELNCKNETWTSFNTDKFPLIEGEIFAIFFKYEGEGEFEFKDFSFKKV